MQLCKTIVLSDFSVRLHKSFHAGSAGAVRGFSEVAQIMFFLAFFLDLVMRWVADGFLFFICNEAAVVCGSVQSELTS